MEKMPDRIDSKFRFVLLAASRAEQLIHGALPKTDEPVRKVTTTAMREVTEDLVDWDYGPAPEPEDYEEGESVEEGAG